MNCGTIYVLLLAVMPAVFQDTDYCDAYLCDRNKKHIACGNDGKIGHNCLGPLIIHITPYHREQILTKHNSLRNKIAQGFKCFPPAKRMATMLWDNELAKFAELNVKQCETRHDECRNTPKFSLVGQNLALTGWSRINFNVSKVIDTQIQTWFDEYKVCPLDVINSYKPSNGTIYDNFTVMVQDKATRIGCAILRYFSEGFKQQAMTCNYAFNNILGSHVYSIGRTASQCTTGTHRKFTSLCSIREKYN